MNRNAVGKHFVEPTSWAWKAAAASLITLAIPTTLMALVHASINTVPEAYLVIGKSWPVFFLVYAEMSLVAGATIHDRSGGGYEVFKTWEFYVQSLLAPLLVLMGIALLTSYLIQVSMYFTYIGLAWLVTFGISANFVRSRMGDF